MEIIGGGNVLEYGPADEGPHQVGDHEAWQESVVLVWWDFDQGLGGMHRIGHEPNAIDGPSISLWNHICSRDWVFKRSARLPLRDEDRKINGFGGGDKGCSFEYTDHAVWKFNEDEIQGELHIEDSHVPVDIYPKKGGLGEDFAPNHMEVGGTVSGQLTVQGKICNINGLAFRDHGWGLRIWSALTSHRWVAGSFGKDMMFLATAFHSSDEQLAGFGCVVRDNKLTYTRDIDILTYLEQDGLTHRGGMVTMTLSTGEVLVMDCIPLQQGVVSWIHGIACVDTLCEVKLNGMTGICDFEITNNALRGSHQPVVAVNGILDNGFHMVSVNNR